MAFTFPGMARHELELALTEGGSVAQIRKLLRAELERSARELKLKRAGYDEPVTVAFETGLYAAFPEGRVVAEAAEQALREAGDGGELLGADCVLHLPGTDAELAALAFDEVVAGVDRLRARAVVVPAGVIEPGDLRPVLREAAADGVPGAHDDPDPARRVARRILQRLSGMGKWGGYHTEYAHLARGFEGNDRALALEVGEALIAAGLLAEKPSVGQRHVFLNPRRKGDIERLVADAQIPGDLVLPPG